jgi:sensor histidine kinase YesM
VKGQSLRHKLLWFIASVIVLMAIINIYSIIVTRSIDVEYSNMINKMIKIDQIGQNMKLSVFYFDKYFSTKAQSDLDNYRKYYNIAKSQSMDLNNSLSNDSTIILQDLQYTLDSYFENGEEAVFKSLSSVRGDDFYSYFLEAKNIASYSIDYVQKLHDSYLKYNNQIYQDLNRKTRVSQIAIIVSFIVIIFFCVFFSIIFSKKITVPIGELAAASQEVAKGNFDICDIKASGINEIDILAKGFNIMVEDIRTLIKEIKQKADVEKRLKDQEMKNLLVENMLKEAQFKALQSQVNPHFLFNTLNTIVQTAVIEGAYETEKLIDSVSELLRYSLSSIDRHSTVGKEIEIIREYAYIQETRFKDRVKFYISMDESLYDVEIPGMTLQPLAENAFIHGIEPKEEGGEISIEAKKEGEFCLIKIEDNGVGMSKDKLQEIMKEDGSLNHKGHTTGIGINNVVKRLKIFCNSEEAFKIESAENMGTKIYIKIPLFEGDKYV